MQIRADAPVMQFDLEGAILHALDGDRTIWLTNGQHDQEICTGDRVYLWSSGVRAEDGKLGKLIAVATVLQQSQPHAQYEWQANFRKGDLYDPEAQRVNLFIDAMIEPNILRSDIFNEYPGANLKTVFFRNGNVQTTAKVEPELGEAMYRLMQDRLARVQQTPA
jgi:hypothetical protein